MTTIATQVQAPPYIDVRSRIPHVRTETQRYRALSEIEHQVAHYEAGGNIPSTWAPEQEIAHLIDVAHFHQTRDFGGGALGRTLEYSFACFPSGRIYIVNDPTLITWSHRDGNRIGISTLYCLGVGEEPTEAMLATARAHFEYTPTRPDMRVIKARTWGHGETPHQYGGGPDWGNSTDCPGKMLAFVRAFREEAHMPGEQNPDANGFFAVTGYSIGPAGAKAIGDYWRAHGDVAAFGYPLTDEQAASIFPWSVLPELRGFTVQEFEYETLAWRSDVGVVRVRVGAVLNALRDREHSKSACS